MLYLSTVGHLIIPYFYNYFTLSGNIIPFPLQVLKKMLIIIQKHKRVLFHLILDVKKKNDYQEVDWQIAIGYH